MQAIRVNSFSGIAPRVQNRLLGDNQAQIADNCRLLSGSLEPWDKPAQVTSNPLATGDVLSLFKMKSGASTNWLSWTRDVDCVPSLIAGDEEQRIYYTGDGEPRMSNYALATDGGGVMPASFFVLGVTEPLVAPTVVPAGGSGTLESRAYIETFVTQYGEESAPSPASTVASGYPDATWDITALNAVPANSGTISGATHSAGVVTVTVNTTKHLRVGEELTHASIVGMTELNGVHAITEVTDATHYKVVLTTTQTYTSGGTWARVAPHNVTGMTRRLYRAISGSYQFVVELPIATLTYVDAVAAADLGEVCPSIGWGMPPTDLVGLTVHPSGFLIGVAKNEICFSDPWHPHSWPVGYRQTTKYPLVGVGVFASSIVACTTGTPYILNGSHPDSLSSEQTEVLEPCLAKRTIVDVGTGIMYSSPNGMVFIGLSGASIATQDIFSRRDWQAVNPETLHCTYYDGMVIAMSSSPGATERSGFVFDSKRNTFSSNSIRATVTFADPEDGKLYLVSDGVLNEWNADVINSETFDWRSKVFKFTKPVNFGCGKVDADFDTLSSGQSADLAAQLAIDIAYNTATIATGITRGQLGDSMLDSLTLDGSLMRSNTYAVKSLRLSLYAKGVLKYTEVVTSDKPFSLPSGFKSTLYEIQLSGNVAVYGVEIAETAKGLSVI